MARRYEASTEFRAIDKMSGPLGRMESRVARFARTASAAVAKADAKVNAMGSGLRNIAGAGAAAGLAVGTIGVNVVNTGMEFERALVGAAARLPGEVRRGTKEFERLKAAALKVGAETEFTSLQAAQALTSMAQAGFTAQQSIATLGPIVDLATAAETDMGNAALIAADSLDAFGMKSADSAIMAKNLSDIMDTMSTVANATTVDLGLLYETITAGAGTARAAGVDMRSFLAMGGIIAPVAKGEKAGMMLKNIFLNLKAPVAEGKKAMAQLGISADQMSEGLKDPIKLLERMKKALGTRKDGTFLIRKIIGKEAFPGFKMLLENIEGLKELRRQTDLSAGATRKMADIIRNNMKGAWDNLTSSIEGVSLSIFYLVNRDLEALFGKVTAWVNIVRDVIGQNRDLVKALGIDLLETIKAVGEAFVILTGIYLTLKSVTMALAFVTGFWNGILLVYHGTLKAIQLATKAWTAAQLVLNLALMANPAGIVVAIVIAAVVAVIALTILAIKYWKQWTGAVVWFFKTLWGVLVKIGEVIGTLISRFTLIGQAIKLLSGKVKTEVDITENRRSTGTPRPGTTAAEDGGSGPRAAAITTAQTTTRSESTTTQKAELWVRNDKGVKTELTGPGRKGKAPAPFKTAPSGAF